MSRRILRHVWALLVLVGMMVAAVPAYAAPEDADSPASDSGASGSEDPEGSESESSESGDPSGSSSAAPTTTEAPAPYCEQAPSASPLEDDAPWTVPMFSVADRIAPYSTGSGVTVAVIDTGVQAAHPQLAGKVLAGYDAVNGRPGANDDCSGHGTGMAGIVAASPMANVGFVGLAPGATILPVRVTAQAIKGDSKPEEMPPSLLAAGIDWAVANGADVIVTGVTFYGAGSPELEASVVNALNSGVVVVAGAGDRQPDDEQRAFVAAPPEFTPYPAAYDGVIGVGSIGAERQRDPKSQIGDYVDITAPGAGLIVPAIGGHANDAGTAYAASYVAATAALVLGAQPPVLTGSPTGATRVQAVTARIIGTASPSPGDGVPMGYGAGIVDPYRALTDMMSGAAPLAPTTYQTPPPDPVADAAAARDASNASRGAIITWSALGLLVIIGTGTMIWRHGRSRAWRPVTSQHAEQSAAEPEPEFVSGEKLFAPKELD